MADSNVENEVWFQKRLELLTGGNVLARPLTEHQWIESLSADVGAIGRTRAERVLQEAKVMELKGRLIEEFGGWQMKKLSELS